ncbi:MAG: ABC transporter ATP-binding protein [Bacillota bacterium]|nr:ABC transporter ATP-binding protein [Bacillota bacterium]
MALLKTVDLGVAFGGLKALSGLDLELEAGELVGLIGPNGAGKTTVFNLLTGEFAPSQGEILFDGRRLGHLKPHQVNRLGIARTFQNIRLFRGLTVVENVEVALHARMAPGFLATLFRLPAWYEREAAVEARALELLELMGLRPYARQLARNLPYGLQRRLEIARALASRPKLLLLDEPAAGMNPQESRALMELIRAIRERFQLTILLIEHDMSVVMGVCERIVVLDHGVEIARGTPEEIRRNPRVIEAYLGEEASADAS